MTAWMVESYFVNIGIGDGAIHLLLKDGAFSAAVLIDGGLYSGLQPLKATITAIKTKYKLKQLVFNSIVVTHWDDDHFLGNQHLLLDNVIDNGGNKCEYIDPQLTTFYYSYTGLKKEPWMKLFKIETNGNKTTMAISSGQKSTDPLCKAVGSTDCIGYDFFTGRNADQWASKKLGGKAANIKVVASAIPAGAAPIFLCVGADDQFINAYSAPTMSLQNAEARAHVMNASSIMCLVVWPQTQANSPPRVSLYTGGDAEEDQEKSLIDWMNVATTKATIDAIKLGHHGSHFASHEDLLSLKPKIFIVSAGEGHGHPSFSLAFFLMAYADYTFGAGLFRPKTIYATRPPYWMLKDPKSGLLDQRNFNITTVLSWYADKLHRAVEKYGGGGRVVHNWFREGLGHMADYYAAKLTGSERDAIDNDRTPGRKYVMEEYSALRATKKLNAEKMDRALQNAQICAINKMKAMWLWYGSPNVDLRVNYPVKFVLSRADATSVTTSYSYYAVSTSVAARISGVFGGTKKGRQGKRKREHPREVKELADKLRQRPKAAKKAIQKRTQQRITKAQKQADTKRKKAGTKGFSGSSRMAAAQELAVPMDEGALVQEYIYNLFADDLRAQTSLPTKLDAFALTDIKDGVLSWFHECFKATAIHIDGEVQADVDHIVLEKITITAALGTEPGGGSAPDLSFTTEKSVRDAEFGKEATQEQSPVGFDDRLLCFVFALSDAKHFSFASLLKFLCFTTPDWISVLLASIPLRKRQSTSQRLARSGLWFMPQHEDRTVLRLEMQPDPDKPGTESLLSFLSDALGPVSFTDVVVYGTCTFESVESDESVMVTTQSNVAIEGTVTASAGGRSFLTGRLAAMIAENGLELTLKLSKDPDILEGLLEWLGERLKQITSAGMQHPHDHMKEGGDSHTAVAAELKGVFSKAKAKFLFRSVSLQFAEERKRLVGFRVNLEVPLPYGSSQDKQIPVLTSFAWSDGHFELSGEIWNELDHEGIPPALHPYRETIKEVTILTPNAIDEIHIPHLLGEGVVFPDGIPSVIDMARVQFSYGPGEKSLFLEGSVTCEPLSEDSQIPMIWFEELRMSLMYNFSSSEVRLTFQTVVEIEASPDVPTKQSTVELGVSVAFVRQAKVARWEVQAYVKDIQVANLFSFFAQDGSNHTIMDVMSQLRIPYASIHYSYTSKTPSVLEITGVILLGPVELDLSYTHDDKGWAFSADAGADRNQKLKDLSVGELLHGLVEDMESIPEFVRSISMSPQSLKVRLRCSSAKDQNSKTKFTIFSLGLETGSFAFTFAKIQRYEGNEIGAPVSLFRFAFTGLPDIKSIPVVEKVKQPFDELDFIWLSADLPRRELDLLNEKAFPAQSPLLYKSNNSATKTATTSETSSAPLTAGCHFQLILHEQKTASVILDYAAGKVKPKTKATSATAATPNVSSPSSQSNVAGAGEGELAMAPMVKSVGPLSIRNIGLKVDDLSKVGIVLDASVRLGPVSFALLGFGVTIDLKTVHKLEDLAKLEPSLSLSGMAVGFDRPPVRLAGMFSTFKTPQSHGYMGGIAVGVGVWSAIAAGMYEERADYKSLFVFGMLQGPLVEFGCAEINGITGGFGYNSHLRLPSVTEVPDFPFVSMNTGKTKPNVDLTQQLVELTSGGSKSFISSLKDSLWFAAGLGIKAFQTVDIQAVIALDLSSEPKFGLFAEAIAVVPKGISEEHAFLVLDFGVSAIMDPSHGLFVAAGQLTPRSFILSRSCKLTGGFAIAYFFAGSNHEGDWVFSVGGFHPNFTLPAHYPPAPPRVGISWSYDDEISIRGEAYFAITPQACMGGGRLDIVYKTSRIRATFSAYADFLIHFRPFQFQAQVGVNVYVTGTIGWGILSTDINVEIGASLELHGPPLAGVAHLHFYFLSYTVHFGPDRVEQAKLTMTEFLTMVKQAKSEVEANALPDHLFSVTGGAIAPDQKGREESDKSKVVRVRGSQLEFEVQTRVPVMTAECNNEPAALATKPEVYATAMQLETPMIESRFTVSVRLDADASYKPLLKATPLVKNVPPAMWKKYNNTTNDASALNNAPMIQHVMGLKVAVQPSKASSENLPAFSSVLFGLENVLPVAPVIPAPQKVAFAASPNATEAPKPGESANQEAHVAATRGVLDAWLAFKSKYSNGGQGRASFVVHYPEVDRPIIPNDPEQPRKPVD